jgi:hypothetical protein
VRSIEVVSESGKRYQIWLDAPDERKEIALHAWDYKKRKVDVKSSLSDLDEKLEEIYTKVMSWDVGFFRTIFKSRESN